MGKSAIRCPACSALNPPDGTACAECALPLRAPVRPLVALGLIAFVGVGVAIIGASLYLAPDRELHHPTLVMKLPAVPLERPGEELRTYDLAHETARKLLDEERYAQLDDFLALIRADPRPTPLGTAPLEYVYAKLAEPRGTPGGAAEGAWRDHVTKARRYRALRKDSVAAHALAAHVLRGWAWFARGTGWGKDVKAEQWEKFRVRLREAEDACLDAQRADPKAIDAWYVWPAIGRGLSYRRERFHDMAKRGFARRPGCTAIFRGYAKYLMPRWHGKPGEWEAYADEAAGMDNALYAQICGAPAESWHENFLTDTRASWPRIHRGMCEWMERAPSSALVLSRFAWWAWKAGDRRVARALLERLGDRYEPEVWEYRQDFEAARGWAL